MINLITRIAFNQGLDEVGKIRFGTGIPTYPLHLAGCYIDTRNQGLRAMARVLKFPGLRLAWPHGQIRRDPLQGLDAGHLIDTDDDFLRRFRRLLIERTDIGYALLFALVSF